MKDPRHPIWFILFCILLLIPVGLIYCTYAYSNGMDLIKDTGLIGLVGTMVTGYNKLVNS